MMKGDLVTVEASNMYPLETVLKSSVRGEKADIGGLASADETSAAVMAWNYHDTDAPAPDTAVTVTLTNIPAKKATLNIYLIDKDNSNSYEVWKKMGSTQSPTAAQISTLEAAGHLKQVSSEKVSVKDGVLVVPLTLQRQAVALVMVEWK